MFGIQTSELIVIALIAILLFGPEKVPEFFHRAGQLMSKIQRGADDMWTSLQTEMNQATKPLEELGKDIQAVGDQLKKPLTAAAADDDTPADADQPDADDRDEPEADIEPTE